MAEQPRIRKSTKASLSDHAPWKPAKYELADAYAIQALARGDADQIMQQRALKWLIEDLCKTYDLSFRPGPEGHRETDFAEGKRFIGMQIVLLLKLNIGVLARRNENG